MGGADGVRGALIGQEAYLLIDLGKSPSATTIRAVDDVNGLGREEVAAIENVEDDGHAEFVADTSSSSDAPLLMSAEPSRRTVETVIEKPMAFARWSRRADCEHLLHVGFTRQRFRNSILE